MIYVLEMILICMWEFICLPRIYQRVNVLFSNKKTNVLKKIYMIIFVLVLILTGLIIIKVLLNVVGQIINGYSNIHTAYRTLYFLGVLLYCLIVIILLHVRLVRYSGGYFVKEFKSKIRMFGDGGKYRILNIYLIFMRLLIWGLLFYIIYQAVRTGKGDLMLLIRTLLIIADVLFVYLNTIFDTFYIDIYKNGRCEAYAPLRCTLGDRKDLYLEHTNNKLFVKLQDVIVLERVCDEDLYNEVEQLIKNEGRTD